VIEKFPEANTVEVTRGVEDALDALRPGLSGIRLDPDVYRPAAYVERAFGSLRTASLAGSLLLLVALAVLLFDWRRTLACAGAIAVSLMAAIGVLLLRGTELDTLFVVGLVLALAAVVGDAVSGAESVGRRLGGRSMNGDRPSRITAVFDAALENSAPIVVATMIGAIAMVPLLFLDGEAAPFTPAVVLSYVLALAASVIVGLVVAPAFGALLLGTARSKPRSAPAARWLERRQHRILERAIGEPRYASAATGVFLLAALLVFPFLDRSPLPSFRDGSVLVEWRAVPGTSLPEMDRITGRVGHELAALPGVVDVGAHVGRAITSDQVVDVDAGQLWASIDPEADYNATVASIRRVVEGYPGISTAVRTYTDERIGRTLAEPEAPIDVRLYGRQFGILQQKAQQVTGILAGIDGVVRPRTQAQPVEPSVDVQVDLRAADRHGIVPGDVRRAASTFVSGIGVGSLFEEQKVFDVVVWGTPDTRNSLSSVRDLLIDTRGGGSVPLGKVAKVSVGPTPSVIRHQDMSRTMDVVADVSGRSVDDVMRELQDKLHDVRFPLEYHAELVGNFPGRQAARSRAIEVTIAAAIAIVLLLQAAFGSWRLAALLFLVPPLAVVGGLIALLVTGTSVSLGPLCALVAVGGASVRSGIMLCRHLRYLERSELVSLGPALVLRGAGERILSTAGSAAAAAIALVPLASSAGPGREVVQPAALVAIGGLIASIPLLCFVLPVLYLRFGSSAAPEPAQRETDLVPQLAGHAPA